MTLRIKKDPFPDTPRHKDARPTEVAAANRARRGQSATCRLVLEYLIRRGGATDYEGSEETGIYHYTYAPRRHDLLVAGFVFDTGDKRPTSTGSPAAVWKATDEGIEWLESL